MYDYKKVLLKCPTPLVIVLVENNHAIIKESNEAYKLYINDKYKLFVEQILTDFIVNFKHRQIEIDNIIYSLQIEKIEENSFIVWFCEKQKFSNEILIDTTMNNKNDVVNKKSKKERFFSFVSHEIKNPLNMILATMQLMERKVNQNIYPQDISKHLDLIKRNSLRIMKIVNDLSSQTKIELGYRDFNPTNQDIVYFVEDICESVRDFVDINDTNIVFDTDEEEMIVGFDCEKIEKIVINLISNSLKFRKKEGAFILVSLSHDDDFIYIKVKDNGIGIAKENINRIFNIYERVNDDRSIIKEGTGIGLSLVRDFARLHHGSISVKSEVGLGSEFIVKIANTLVSENQIKAHHELTKEERLQNIAVALSDI